MTRNEKAMATPETLMLALIEKMDALVDELREKGRPLLTGRQAAKLLDMHENTFNSLAHRGVFNDAKFLPEGVERPRWSRVKLLEIIERGEEGNV